MLWKKQKVHRWRHEIRMDKYEKGAIIAKIVIYELMIGSRHASVCVHTNRTSNMEPATF